jgi:hypothetical protein
LEEQMFIVLFYYKKHISYYHTNSALQDYLWRESHPYGGTMQIPLSVVVSSVSKACYYHFYQLACCRKNMIEHIQPLLTTGCSGKRGNGGAKTAFFFFFGLSR